MKRIVVLGPMLLSLVALLAQPPACADEPVETYREWIESMKQAERGPFARIRWFCNDGTVLPPEAYACSPHGGGHQHGQWSERTETLRDAGYRIANLLAGVRPDEYLAAEEVRSAFAQLLIERYLMAADDGWIFRRALFYRGAIQEEDERAGARALLTEMASRDAWIGPGFTALRAGARLLPHGADTASFQRARQLAASLSDRDSGFRPLRAKIHGRPEGGDAARVRAYAESLPEGDRASYLELADEIDAVFQPAPLAGSLNDMAARYTAAPWLQDILRAAAASLGAEAGDRLRFEASSKLLADLRGALPRVNAASVRLELIDLGLRLEDELLRTATLLRPELAGMTRSERLALLRAAGDAAYGTGLVNARLRGELAASLDRLASDDIGLDRYLAELRYLGRVPHWATQALRMHFFEAMQTLARIEPKAMLFIQDQLRGSPLLMFSEVLDGLGQDASKLAGVEHRLFGETVGVGFTALNPGLATGVLYVTPDLDDLEDFRADGIYVLPETVSDLPPIAGILTGGEGNPLSHVQLLARNLGIPNVAIDERVQSMLADHDGQQVVMAVSPTGLVEIEAFSEEWRERLGDEDAGDGVTIAPDLDKLDLSVQRVISLDELEAEDSGRTVGPKAAKLGELRKHYPEHVGQGLALPFGLFKREALDRPHPDGGGSIWDWLVDRYAALATIPETRPEHAAAAEALRADLYDLILSTPISEAFRTELRRAIAEEFGEDGPPGLFVRSDTNVEDLAGFTGAGLNLTLPNVVGEDALLEGIVRVWASPFTARAFAWRQSHMTQPEHVYTSILLLESTASDKSGVLVTQDIDTGDRGVLSVAVNEGLGGAVDGQAAESLRIPLDGSPVRVLATATAPFRRVPASAGGLDFLPASGADAVLTEPEIEALIEFARDLPERFPPITDDEGNPAPADIEFGFVDGELQLFQLRPFLESKSARGVDYLHAMERRLADSHAVRVPMNEVPQ